MKQAGFGIGAVMVGSVVLGIFALSFMQNSKNSIESSLIAQLIAYRDSVLHYYAAIVSNRIAWRCTMLVNPSLRNYVSGGGGGGGSLTISDAGDCRTALSGDIVVPDIGVYINFGDTLPIPISVGYVAPASFDFHLQAEWQAIGGGNGVEVTLTVIYNRSNGPTNFALEDKQVKLYMNRTVAKDCSDGLSTSFGFYDDGGTGSEAERYWGDTAVTSIDAETRLVTCWESGPLIIPPCYEDSSDYHSACSSSYLGMCPSHSGVKVPSIAGFDRSTGKTECSYDHVLIKRPSTTCSGGGNGILGFDGSGNMICAHNRGFTGVRGRSTSMGIKGFSSGTILSVSGQAGRTGERGPPGDPRPDVTSTCTRSP